MARHSTVPKAVGYAEAKRMAEAAIVAAGLARQSEDELERQRAPLVKRKLLLEEEIARLRVRKAKERPSEVRKTNTRIDGLKAELASADRELMPLRAQLNYRAHRFAQRFLAAAAEQLAPDVFLRLYEAADGDGAEPQVEAAK